MSRREESLLESQDGLRGDGDDGSASRIRLRAVILVFLLVPAHIFWMVSGNWTVGSGGYADSLSATAIVVVCVLVAANGIVKRRRSGRGFLNRAEILTLYIVVALTNGLCADIWEWGSQTASIIAWPVWNAGPDNNWDQIMLPHLPSYLTVQNREVLAGFFLGDANPYQWSIIREWLTPAMWWTVFVTVLLLVTLCLNTVVFRRWSREQNLTFPLTSLPLSVTDPRGSLFRSPLWWLGIALSVALIGLATVSQLVPAIPQIPTSYSFEKAIAGNKPWDGLRCPYLSWGPWELGLAYLMPAELAFALIAFNIFWRAEYVASRALGWTVSAWDGFPYGDEQTIGAYLAVILSVMWLDRRYLVQVGRRALGLPSAADDSGQGMSYRMAVLGALIGLAFLWWFLARGGMTALTIMIWLSVYFLMALVMGRMRAQMGPPSHEMYGAMPLFILPRFPGSRAMGERGTALMGLLEPFTNQQRTNPAPTQLEALRISERAPADSRRLTWLMLAIVPVGVIVYFWASLHIGYDIGLGTGKAHQHILRYARQSMASMDTLLREPSGPDWYGLGAVGVGGAVTIALMALKLRFPFWPLHPVAFPLAFAWPIDSMLPAIVVTWAVKVLLLRYGGLRAYRGSLPFFFGLIVGSAVAQLVQSMLFRKLGIAG